MCHAYRIKMDHQWEIARWQVASIINTKLKKGAKLLKPSDLVELSIDRKQNKPSKIKRFTAEEIIEIKRKHGTL